MVNRAPHLPVLGIDSCDSLEPSNHDFFILARKIFLLAFVYPLRSSCHVELFIAYIRCYICILLLVLYVDSS